jgi:hypothetical protein
LLIRHIIISLVDLVYRKDNQDWSAWEKVLDK